MSGWPGFPNSLGRTTMTALPVTLTAFLIAVLASPPVHGDDPPPVQKQDILRSQENLKKIGKAFHDFHTANLLLPRNMLAADGKPLHSWRVAILPHLGEEELFKQFKLHEPWDSAHNKKLIPKIPKVYAPLRVEAKKGETFYQIFSGAPALFGPNHLPKFPGSIPDGTTRTGTVFEAGKRVIWTKPADMPFDEEKPLPPLGGMFDGEFNVCLADGSVLHVKKDANEKLLKLLIMPADGYAFDLDELKKK